MHNSFMLDVESVKKSTANVIEDLNKIIENKKYNPPIHWVEDLHNIKPWSICLIFSKIVKPVEVNPDTDSKIEFKKVKL